MIYTRAVNADRFYGIATSDAGARGFLQRLVMQTVFDVLERQGRSALLPDAVISAILDQLSVEISYTPMNCPMVTTPEEESETSILSNYSKLRWQNYNRHQTQKCVHYSEKMWHLR
ncbi:hypothetical protein KIN20_036810 [Parelaphostrongylus tenuis]|uniref:Uncharacterized protein n=1 Tax=Parelaphostrongylus tenuis TaxID=148309 RepID=A0AAD5RD29_PARTN|nr:hypothetical protein KIN20_036810 [Parelaphostrongylus tenuis]